MLRFLLRIVTVFLLSIVLVSRFGVTDLLASEISSTYLVEQANQDRQAKGLNPLKYNKKLERAALLKAENMFKLQYWAHYGPNKESPWQFILQSGYTYAYAGENLAKGFSDSQSVHDAWMASPTHRANIMDPQFQEVGIAVVKGKLLGADIFLVVQMFGSPTYQVNSGNEKHPEVKITFPKDGDILEDGITDIRGEAVDLDNPTVTLYINKTLLGSVPTSNTEFILSSPLTAAQGDQTITAKAIGPEDVYLSDTVVVTIVNNKTEALGVSKSCIESKMGISALTITYECQRENAGMSATLGSTRYTQEKNIREVQLPLNSLPKEDATVIITVTFDDGTSTAFSTTLSELGRSENNAQTAGTTQRQFKLPTLNLRNWVFGIFGLSFVLLLLYAGELAYKRQLMTHRYELLSFTLFLGILLISFNFGFVRV